jgi:hypothetical protein
MRSYTSGLNQYGVWTKNTTTANLTDGAGVANDIYKKICEVKDWPFLEQLRIVTTTAATANVALPYDCDMVREVAVTPVGQTKRYTPKLVRDAIFWDQINLTSFQSDIPEYYYVFSGSIYLWPTPVSPGNSIRITQKTKPIDMSFADITTSTVTSITNGQQTLVVSGGLTTMMVGLWVKIAYVPGTTNTGDGQPYQIAGVTNSTTCTLERVYGGTSISAGSAACTISQLPLLPEAYQDTPWKAAAGKYWATNLDPRSSSFLADFDADLKLLGIARSSPTTSYVIDTGDMTDIINPNLTITL